MPNIKSAKKRVLVNAKKMAQNRMAKTELKTELKKAALKIDEKAPNAFIDAQKALDKAVARGLLHKNKASRLKSRFALKVAK